MKFENNWIFYSEDDNGIRTIQSFRRCLEPSKTKEYKHIQSLLDFNNFVRVGYMSAQAWNENSQYIKFAY